MKILITICILFSLGCMTGPKTKKKSPLNHLSGEHYNTSPTGQSSYLAPVPILERKAKTTQIKGSVEYKEGLINVPLQHQSLILENEKGEVLAKASSSTGGRFEFSVPLKNGKYFARIESNKYEGKVPVVVSSYEVTGVILLVSEK